MASELTTCTKLALQKGGYYDNLIVVDSLGVMLRVSGAKKLHGIGLFWGYNLFLNQQIKVSLVTDGAPVTIPIAEVKKYVLNSFARWHGWSSRGDFDELEASIEKAASISEIITQLNSTASIQRKPFN